MCPNCGAPAETIRNITRVKTLSCGVIVASTDLLSIEIIRVFFPSKGPVGKYYSFGLQKGTAFQYVVVTKHQQRKSRPMHDTITFGHGLASFDVTADPITVFTRTNRKQTLTCRTITEEFPRVCLKCGGPTGIPFKDPEHRITKH